MEFLVASRGIVTNIRSNSHHVMTYLILLTELPCLDQICFDGQCPTSMVVHVVADVFSLIVDANWLHFDYSSSTYHPVVCVS